MTSYTRLFTYRCPSCYGTGRSPYNDDYPCGNPACRRGRRWFTVHDAVPYVLYILSMVLVTLAILAVQRL